MSIKFLNQKKMINNKADLENFLKGIFLNQEFTIIEKFFNTEVEQSDNILYYAYFDFVTYVFADSIELDTKSSWIFFSKTTANSVGYGYEIIFKNDIVFPF